LPGFNGPVPSTTLDTSRIQLLARSIAACAHLRQGKTTGDGGLQPAVRWRFGSLTPAATDAGERETITASSSDNYARYPRGWYSGGGERNRDAADAEPPPITE
jgi:hypothetical protein